MSTSNTDYLLSILETIDGGKQLNVIDGKDVSENRNKVHSLNLEMHEELKGNKNVIKQY